MDDSSEASEAVWDIFSNAFKWNYTSEIGTVSQKAKHAHREKECCMVVSIYREKVYIPLQQMPQERALLIGAIDCKQAYSFTFLANECLAICV